MVSPSEVPDAVPKVEPLSKYGNPPSYVVNGKRYYVMDSSDGFLERGIASWYGEKFHGRRTSSGETYDMYAMTAAHKSLPLPTYVEVENLRNRRKILVKVNDRGPFHENRIIDLSYTAARKLDIVKEGTALVEVRAINPITYGAVGTPVNTVSASDTNSIDSFFIQVGAFSNYSNAAKLKNKLSPLKNTQVHISEALVDENILYRVRIGPIIETSFADQVVANLGKLGIYEHHVVVDL